MRSQKIAMWMIVAGLAAAGRPALAAQAPGTQTARPPAVPADPTGPLGLAQALEIATDRNPSLDVARAGEARASAAQQRANSQFLPQVTFLGGYNRTLASEFSSAVEQAGPPCAPLAVDATQPVTARVAELERAASCGGFASGFNFGSLPFGQRNVYQGTFTFAQTLYAGGRLRAAQTQANQSLRLAQLVTSSAGAQLALDVTRAFYDAALSDRLVTIAELAFQQASDAYDQTKLSFDAGRQPEFELLRAQVARDNQRPLVIRRRADRDVAYLRLRQVLGLAPGGPLPLDLDLDGVTLTPPAPFADALAKVMEAPVGDARVVIEQAQTSVQLRDAAVTIARAERLPAVNLSSSYGKVGYPSSGAFPSGDDFRTNWTLGAQVSVPIFVGQRLKADELSARADLAEAQAQLRQTRDLSQLDEATARQDLTAAEATWEASAGTVQQAQRAYEIATLRNREGLSTQLELSDSRLSLQTAQANRAQAARDVQVARARLALLPNLPVSAR